MIADVDGDTVAIKTSKGTVAQLTAALTLSGMGLSGVIRELDFSKVPLVGGVNPFAGTDLTISVVKQGALGDGRVNVGYIDASSSDGGGNDGSGIALGKVKIGGDLGQIDAGIGGANVAIKGLTAQSVGAWGNATQGANGSTTSNLLGKVGAIKVRGTVNGASLFVNGPVASIDIGGSFLDSSIAGSGALAKVRIGAGTLGSGISAASVGSMEVKGIMTAGITLTGNLDSLKVAGDIFLAKIAAVDIASVIVTGSMYGQDGAAESGVIAASGNMGKVKIGGDLRGGSAASSGRIAASGNIESITIGGSLVGPYSAPDSLPSNYIATNSSSIFAAGNLKNARIGGSIIGSVIQNIVANGASFVAACCTITANGDIGAVSIGGSMVGISGEETNTSANVRIAAQHIDSVSIGGDFTGTSAFFDPPEIFALGGGEKPAIGKFFVGGTMRLATVIAGAISTTFGDPRNADGQIGSVIIRGNLASATITTLDIGMGVTDNVNVVSKIATIAIGGFITGNSVIRAEHIASVTLSGVALKLKSGERNDTTAFVFGPGSGSIAELL